MDNAKIENGALLFTRAGEVVRLTAVGENAIRFEGFPGCRVFEENFTLLPGQADAVFTDGGWFTEMTVGRLSARLERSGKIAFSIDGAPVLEEKPELAFNDGWRHYDLVSGERWKARVTFEGRGGERFYGLGHEATGRFDLKGCAFDLRHVNAKCTIPYVYSSLGYGFLWNNPGVGNVELAENRTRWTADATKKIDYVVIAGSPRETAAALADLTGHAPVMPHWATGFWQSRLRYETQEELLKVARRYKAEGIPLSVIICDYFHWTEQGDYAFDPACWPDPEAMTKELHGMGVKLMVSVWPTINENSKNYRKMRDRNLLIRTARGADRVFSFYGPQAEIDVTNPETRAYVMARIKEGYLDKGVDALWFDEAEPEVHPEQFDNLLFHAGRGDEVGLLYPYYYAQMAWEGLREYGQETPVTLTRCAYPGSQKFGALVWSGDIPSTFKSLDEQVKAGLNMAMCGIPWWNTDIGGFWGGDTTDGTYRELIVRWFQFGVFSPVMRVHGNRSRHGAATPGLKEPSGDPNEVWSFGEENFPILKDLILLRERLRPYIEREMKKASATGAPVMRPMFFDFPGDDVCYTLGGQYMFGDDILFAPVTEKGQREKTVYLPEGRWVDTKTKKVFTRGTYTVKAELTDAVAFVRYGAEVLEAFK